MTAKMQDSRFSVTFIAHQAKSKYDDACKAVEAYRQKVMSSANSSHVFVLQMLTMRSLRIDVSRK